MKNNKDESSNYSVFTWIIIIVLIFVIAFLFSKYFNNRKPLIRSEHFSPQLYKDGIHLYNWNPIQATVSSNFKDQMRSGIPGPVNAIGDKSIGCYKGYVTNLYDRSGDRCCVTTDETDYKNNCCNGTDRSGKCAQWDDFSTKIYRHPMKI